LNDLVSRQANLQPIQIYPGSPWENGYNERLNGSLRQQALNAERFMSTRQAVMNHWLRQYNHVSPHHALGVRPLVPETFLVIHQITGADKGARQGERIANEMTAVSLGLTDFEAKHR
jgi:hypothetical protein